MSICPQEKVTPLKPVLSQRAPEAPSTQAEKKAYTWEGVKLVPFLATFAIGAGLWMMPTPEGLDTRAWHLFAVFVSTIFAVIARPLPMGPVALTAIAVCVLTETLTLQESLSGFSAHVVWLVVLAFFIARGFIKTGLGARVAYYFISRFGSNTMGLAYSFIATEFLLAPVVPSNTARGAGILYPIINALNRQYGSHPNVETRGVLGSFLMCTCFHANVITSAMFMTALAGNSVIVALAADAGVVLDWSGWALACVLPGLCCLIILPWVVKAVNPPQLTHTPNAPQVAREKLQEMGSLSFNEILMLVVFALLLGLWAFGNSIGISATTTALLGLVLLLFAGVLTWDDIQNEKGAWNTMVWFATLLMLAGFLSKFGMTRWFSEQMSGLVSSMGWVTAFALMGGVYFYIHYFFASATAHITALYSAFLLVAMAAGTPPMVAALGFAVMSSISGGLTHYGTGTAPVYFGSGYVPIKTWWLVGAVVSTVSIAIWTVVAIPWWAVLGLY